MGQKLFDRLGRKLVLTDVGQVVFRYAEEIFSLGSELMDTLQQKPVDRPLRLRVGIADVLPKLVAIKLLEPALASNMEIRLSCHEDRSERLLAELAIHNLDVVLTDSPIGSSARIRGFNHLLGESDILVFAASELARKHRRSFPESLEAAPFLLPSEGTIIRQSLERWFNEKGIRPRIVGEFDDSALLKSYGQFGMGMFASPAIIQNEIRRQYSVKDIGIIDGFRERFYAITVDRHLKHPAVVALTEVAGQEILDQ